MKDDNAFDDVISPHPISRRDFTMLSLAAGMAAAARLDAAPAVAPVAVADVEIRTPEGNCDAALACPTGAGHWPAVIMFPDAFGLRATMREMAGRLAGAGYTVLVPNPFYRSTRAPGIGPKFDFQKPEDRALLAALRAPLSNDGVAQDVAAFTAFLDRLPAVNRKAGMGVVGYCMGGRMTMQAAAAVPARIGAGASFHGGGLVTDKPDSPHLLVPRIKARYYLGVAANDDEREPDAKRTLAEAFRAAGRAAKLDVYPGTLHGWCIRDMPRQGDQPVYNEQQAERAWSELLALFKLALV